MIVLIDNSPTEAFLYSLRKISCFFVLKSEICYISTFHWFYFKIYVQTAEILSEKEKKKKIKSCQRLERLNIPSLSVHVRDPGEAAWSAEHGSDMW